MSKMLMLTAVSSRFLLGAQYTLCKTATLRQTGYLLALRQLLQLTQLIELVKPSSSLTKALHKPSSVEKHMLRNSFGHMREYHLAHQLTVAHSPGGFGMV